jgi:hypothetical protein
VQKFATFAAVLCALALPALAQDSGVSPRGDFGIPEVRPPSPAPSSPPAAAPAAPRTGPLSYIGATRPQWNAFVIGDILAEGMWGGLVRMSEGNERLKLSLRMKEESGLARPGVYDWPAALDRIVEANEVDVVIVMLGNNDGQDMQGAEGRIAFGTPQWRAAYGAAVDRLMTGMKDRGIAVYWLGVPPAGSPERDDALKLVNAVQKERADANGVRFIDLRALFTDSGDRFVDSGADEQGNVVRMRMRDGLRMLKAGNTRAALAILPVIAADIEAADAAVRAPSAPVAVEVPAAPATGPQFGAGGEREDWAARPVAPDVPTVERADRLDERDLEVRGIVTEFTERSMLPPPKPGRIDDFSYTAPAAN